MSAEELNIWFTCPVGPTTETQEIAKPKMTLNLRDLDGDENLHNHCLDGPKRQQFKIFNSTELD
jgi:hypothetical protein